MAGLIDHSEHRKCLRVLGGNWSRLEAQLIGQLQTDNALQNGENRFIGRNAVRDGPVAMGTIIFAHETEGQDGPPKGLVAKRVQPLLHIINRLKRLHVFRIPNPSRALQI